MTEFNLSEKNEKLKEKVEEWRDYFYHEVDGFEEDANEMMNELLNEIHRIEKQDKEFIKRLKEDKKKFKEFTDLSYIQGWKDCFSFMVLKIDKLAGENLK